MEDIYFMKKYIISLVLLTSFYYPCTINIERDGENSEKINRKKTLILIQIIQVRMNQILLNNHLKKIL